MGQVARPMTIPDAKGLGHDLQLSHTQVIGMCLI